MAGPKWREFEVLVARIEEWLGPKGAKVKSPDKLRDRITGQMREVDASIRFQVGSAPILVTVECRDRKKTEDVRWIEEIAGKRDSVGAARTIAVSSSGFSQPARIKAEQLGIEVREINDISAETAAQWAHDVKITFVSIRWNVVALRLHLRGAVPGNDAHGSFPPEIAEAFQKNPSDTKIGFERCSGKPLTVRSVIEGACSKCPEFTEGAEVGKPALRKTLAIGFPANSFALYTTKGERDLEKMRLTVDVWQTSESLPPAKVVRYESVEGTVLEIAQTDSEVEPGRRITILYSQTRPDDAPVSTPTDDQRKPVGDD